MPVHKTILEDGTIGYKFGTHGKAYKRLADARRQERAIFASGWKGHKKKASNNKETFMDFKTVYTACMSKVAADEQQNNIQGNNCRPPAFNYGTQQPKLKYS